YNTLTRTVEPFAPADGKTVRMYTCGPTVYNPAHIGNFRTFLFEDLLRRVLRANGWRVVQIMNLTDVDDKIIKRAVEQKKTITQVTEPVTEIFHADRKYLRIEDAEEYPKATTHIPEMIALVQTLLDKGIAYVADDKSVYFAIARFPGYGRLSRLDTREIKAGARVAQDDYSKENAQDFALWKAAKPEDEATGAAWDAPFGRGRPGWHLECSAMAMKFLGKTLDIHCGGVDLIFPHHEDEMAQSEAATGEPFARFWCHGEFLLIDGSKMAKRVGNVANVQDLRDQGISAAALRHFVFSTHYRKQINLSAPALESSLEAVRRVGEFKHRLDSALGGTAELAAVGVESETAVREALNDDLNAPEAVAALFSFIQRGNAELDRRGIDAAALQQARASFAAIDAILDVVPEVVRIAVGHDGTVTAERPAVLAPAVQNEIDWALTRLADRRAKRAVRDFAAADALREEVEARGFAVKDTGHGVVIERYL
ncbi:MAG: cysteine--tRNA ligase, partial [Gemmatimonadaceae bacterium]